MKKYLFTLVIFSCLVMDVTAQGFAWGIKGGPSIGFQRWDNTERDPLFAYHGILYIESLDNENAFTLFAQTGYHKRGSAVRIRPFIFEDTAGQIRTFSGQTTKYEFTNISLAVGAKQKYDFGVDHKMYYLFGIRGEYTIANNLDQFEEISTFSPFYPFEGAVQNWNAGFIFGGGLEFRITDLIGAIVELTVNPDFTKQYFHPDIPNVRFPSSNGQTTSRTLRERSIRNNTIELSVGFRFLRKVEYID